MVKQDYRPPVDQDIHSSVLSLSQGDVVEILDNKINGKWFVRARSESGAMSHGWFPSALLERVVDSEEVDGGKKTWIEFTAGACRGP